MTRAFTDGVLESPDLPPMRMRVDPSLRYIGATSLEIKAIALADAITG